MPLNFLHRLCERPRIKNRAGRGGRGESEINPTLLNAFIYVSCCYLFTYLVVLKKTKKYNTTYLFKFQAFFLKNFENFSGLDFPPPSRYPIPPPPYLNCRRLAPRFSRLRSPESALTLQNPAFPESESL